MRHIAFHIPVLLWLSMAVLIARDLRSTYATRLSAGGVVDEWVIQMLRQGDSQVFKKYSQMKREALDKINRRANEMSGVFTQRSSGDRGFDTVLAQ